MQRPRPLSGDAVVQGTVGSKAAMTPGEIKAEKRLRILTVIGAPVVIVASLAALVINSPNMRERIETYLPGFGMRT